MSSPSFTFDDAVNHIRTNQLSIQDATRELLAELTTSEKLSILTGPYPFWPGLKRLLTGALNRDPYLLGPVARLKIPGFRFCDGPRGVVLAQATCFPIAMARGATWDTELEVRVGEAMAAEARARGVNMSGAVCINLPRHPAWGRIQETYSEDPVLLGEFGIAVTEGLQHRGGVVACVKHFALNSMEDARFDVDVSIDEAALHEVFLPHFEMVVKEGKAMSVMSAYNSMNGEWCGQNSVLLNDILRKQWGFEYFVISDWVFGLRDSPKSLRNGLDLEAPFAQVRSRLQAELDSGKFTIEDVERSATRLLSTQLELYSRRTTADPDNSVMLCQDHRDLSRKVAARSMVLLKNDPVSSSPPSSSSPSSQSILPINPVQIQKCAIIGKLANAKNTGDWGSSYVNSPHVVTPYEGIKSALSQHSSAAEVVLSDSDSISEATSAASNADFAVIVVGYDALDEGENLSANNPLQLLPWPNLTELVRDLPVVAWLQLKERLGFSGSGPSVGGKAGGDRKSVRLPAKNIELIRAVRKANPRTVVAIVASGAVIVDEWIDGVEAVLMNWYSGCEGGHALADVLFGDVDASGRLPFSVPKDEKDLPFFDAKAHKITYDKWWGQRLLDRKGVEARFPLGHGLSYTRFEMHDLHVKQQEGGDFLEIHVTVKNIGLRDGRHVVQVYGCPVGITAQDDFPTRVLMGFSSVELKSQESKQVKVRARVRPLQRWQSGEWVLASRDVEIQVGSYAGDSSLSTRIEMV